MRCVIVSILLVSIVFAGTATQTDWSGGGGVQGPVSDWSDLFWSSDSIDFNQEELKLSFYPVSPIEHTVSEHFDGAWSVYATDIDGDGDADILGAAQYEANINWWENTDGTGTNWTEHTVVGDFGGASVYSTDIDGDGDADVLGASEYYNDIIWWENIDGTGTSWAEYTVDGNFYGATSVYATDIDGDGDADILGAAQDANDITWWENNIGTGTSWTRHTVDGNFYGAQSVYATDIDGDGDTDILGAAALGDDIAWWENSDTSPGVIWTEHMVDGDFDGARSVYATDVDGDGDADVLGAAWNDDYITWWENTDGTGINWTEHPVDENFNGANSVYSTDIDGDGDADVLGAAVHARKITWWENSDGTGTNWTEHTVDGNFDAARSAYATDINGDGAVDILGAAHGDNDITWWDVLDYSPTGVIESSILDAGDIEEWNIFLANVQAPIGSSISYQFRSSDDSSNMGSWSDTVFSPDTPLEGILADSTRYLQYRVMLQTTDPQNTSVLYDLSFSYTAYLGIADNGTSSWGLVPYTNPSFGNLTVQVSVPQPGIIDLVLHDISGRLIAQYSQELPGGTHSVSFNNLAEGVYFCTMQAEEFSATERIVVLD